MLWGRSTKKNSSNKSSLMISAVMKRIFRHTLYPPPPLSFPLQKEKIKEKQEIMYQHKIRQEKRREEKCSSNIIWKSRSLEVEGERWMEMDG
ncbi:hypothetical protein HYFRA_00014192 [Hymenoscyphus fraxineus]|uniref:Uncharacterized protein n=1 Tax=Hymenoscyphus fraxineus TaxID=746836 RepID=A0A9N9LDS2_9HELO|nr:hypothetical protein HYFRA_00014192 [Hymenoscyphus fraxineus]